MKTLVVCSTCKNDFREYFRDEPLTGFCKKHCKNYHLQKVIECPNLSKYVDRVTNIKPPAIAYIDDRAIPFLGDYKDTLRTLSIFEPYWK